MERGTLGDAINPWGVRLFQTLKGVAAVDRRGQSAYDKWLDQTSTREQARRDRIHGAVGVIPTPLWIVLFVISGVIFVFMLFFADSGERAVDAGAADGLGHGGDRRSCCSCSGVPGQPVPLGRRRRCEPTAMERSLRIIDQALGAHRRDDQGLRIPCDAGGRPQ